MLLKVLRRILLAGLLALLWPGAFAATMVVTDAATQPVAPSEVADAVMQHDTGRLQGLLKAHADVNAPQPDGSTALHWAAYQEDAHLAAILLAAGALPNAVTDTG